MKVLRNKVMAFLRDESGLTTVEYAIAGALVSLAVATGFQLLGTAVGAKITDLTNCINGTCP